MFEDFPASIECRCGAQVLELGKMYGHEFSGRGGLCGRSMPIISIQGELCVTEIYDEAAKWSLDLSASCYNLLFLYVQQEKENGSEREMNTFVHLQEEILQYFLRFPQYILFRWNVNCYGVLVKCDAEEMEDYTQRAIAQIQMNCESQNANADWYVVVGTPVERLSMLKECYDRVNHYGAYRFLYPQMHVLSEETLKSYLPAQDDTRIAEVDATKMSLEIISEFLAKGSSKEVYNFVESYLQSISEVIHSVIFRDYVVLNIRFTAIAFMERNGVTKEEFLAHIGKYGTNVHVQQDEVFEYFLSILQTAIDLRDEQNTNLSSKTLKKALAYIDEHYTKWRIYRAVVRKYSGNKFKYLVLLHMHIGSVFADMRQKFFFCHTVSLHKRNRRKPDIKHNIVTEYHGMYYLGYALQIRLYKVVYFFAASFCQKFRDNFQ